MRELETDNVEFLRRMFMRGMLFSGGFPVLYGLLWLTVLAGVFWPA